MVLLLLERRARSGTVRVSVHPKLECKVPTSMRRKRARPPGEWLY